MTAPSIKTDVDALVPVTSSTSGTQFFNLSNGNDSPLSSPQAASSSRGHTNLLDPGDLSVAEAVNPEVVKRQQQVEQKVNSLLKRLDELPTKLSETDSVADPTEDIFVTGREPLAAAHEAPPTRMPVAAPKPPSTPPLQVSPRMEPPRTPPTPAVAAPVPPQRQGQDVSPGAPSVEDTWCSPEADSRAASTSVTPDANPYSHKVTQLSAQSPADQSLLPPGSTAGTDVWRGWTIQTSTDGRLFYHHSASNTSQWQMPRELAPVLGEWVQLTDEAGGRYWRNELLGVSSWKDPRQSTTLFQAALDGNLFFLQLYAEIGGFLDALDAKGRTALHYTCAGGSTQAVLYLLQHKASLDIADSGGSTPLHWACRYGHGPIVRTLLEARCLADCQNSLGDTPLHEAAALGRADPLHWLLVANANPSFRNRESKTPAEVANANGAFDAGEMLLQQQSNPRWRGRSGRRSGSGRGKLADPANAPSLDWDDSEEEKHAVPKYARGGGATSSSSRRRPQSGGHDSDSDDQAEEQETSVALVIVRVARPLLRGVQWLANRVLGEKKTDLGENNNFEYDAQRGEWVERKLPREESDPGESGSSAQSGSDEEPPEKPIRHQRQRHSLDSDPGAPGAV